MPSERVPLLPLRSPEGLDTRVDRPLWTALGSALGGTVLGILDCPLQKRRGVEMPDPWIENMEGLDVSLKTCFWLSFMAVSCITLRSSFHCAIGIAEALLVLSFQPVHQFLRISRP